MGAALTAPIFPRVLVPVSEDQGPETEPQTGQLSVPGEVAFSPAFLEGRAQRVRGHVKDRLARTPVSLSAGFVLQSLVLLSSSLPVRPLLPGFWG